MRLADRIAQCRTPFVVENTEDGSFVDLNNAAAFSRKLENCATRYVLSDELTALCTALAYSKGANSLACVDLLRVPAERLWVEWTEASWRGELARYGFKSVSDSTCSGRRGVYIESCPQGRHGIMRTFWSNEHSDLDVLASSMEAYFDFDTQEGEEPADFDWQDGPPIGVSDGAAGRADILRRCFRFRYERSWRAYYDAAQLPPFQTTALTHHALGTIAIDIPVVLAFLLLLVSRPALPVRPLRLERLNRARCRSGKSRLLEQIEVFSPLLPEYRSLCDGLAKDSRRASRLHHVRGHLVRRGGKIFWRVPHLRGSARSGVINRRTVAWIIDMSDERRAPSSLASRVASAEHVHPSA